MKKVEYLPLGSIVYLRNGTKKLMIIARGLMIKNNEEIVFFDYAGVPYPEGLQGERLAYFQHEVISKVEFSGYHDSDDEMAVENINAFAENHPDVKRGEVLPQS